MKDLIQIGAAILVILAIVLAPELGFHWYRSGVQKDIYASQGIEITQYEVFIGCHPAQTTVTVKSSK